MHQQNAEADVQGKYTRTDINKRKVVMEFCGLEGRLWFCTCQGAEEDAAQGQSPVNPGYGSADGQGESWPDIVRFSS